MEWLLLYCILGLVTVLYLSFPKGFLKKHAENLNKKHLTEFDVIVVFLAVTIIFVTWANLFVFSHCLCGGTFHC